jgi:hypothetical protein
MMKRSATLLLTKVYLITALGFALNLHYCGGVLAAVKINAPAKTCKPQLAGKMKCCNEKEIDVKLKYAHQGQSASFLSGLFGFEIPKIPFGDYVLSAQQALLEKLSDPAPPPPPCVKTDPVIKNRNLRI